MPFARDHRCDCCHKVMPGEHAPWCAYRIPVIWKCDRLEPRQRSWYAPKFDPDDVTNGNGDG